MRPESLGIIGLGAIGGSVAWCAQQAGVPRIIGYSRATADTVEALKRGAITEAADTPEQVARRAAMVILATPPVVTCDLLGKLAGWLAPAAIATDVASVKSPIVQAAMAAGLGERFAGSHPLAGTHHAGFAAASASILEGAVIYVCTTAHPAADGVARAVAGFWRAIARAEPVRIDAAMHDAQLAWTSHLPQAVASALASAIATRNLGGVSFGTGARDTMRLAASDPALWVEILLANAGPVSEGLAAAGDELQALRRALDSRDAQGVRSILERAAAFRRGLDR